MSELVEKHPKQAEERVERLKERKKRCVCKHCGGELKLRRIIFSAYEEARIELYCNHCRRIEYGVEWQVYQSAQFYVEHTGINLFPGLDDTEQCKEMNIAKVAEIMDWENHNLGLCDESGFAVLLKFNTEFMAECTTISEKALDDIDEEIEDLIAIE